MKMNNKMQSYNKQALSIAIILCVMVVLALFIPIQKTYADYSDLNENSIVNFNQLAISPYYHNYDFTYTSGNSRFVFTNQSLNIANNNVLYIKINSSDSDSALYFNYSSGITAVAYTIANDFERLFTTTDILNDISLAQTNNKTFYNIVVVNLTQMFGEGNEPNLIQAQEYFTSDYYDYTTGIAMPYSKGYLQGYKDGAKDTLESLHATYNNDILGTIAYPVNYNGIESNLTYDSEYNRYILYGICGLNFGDYITSTITYKGTYFMPNYEGGIYIVFFKYEGGIMNPIATSEIEVNNNMDAEHYWHGSCNIRFNVNNQDIIYFGFFTSYGTFNESTATTLYSWSSELEVETLNINAIIQSAIAKGQRDVLNQYEPGSIAYESIYQQGFNEGLARENGFGTALELVGTTFAKVGEILQIQILPGIPVGLFVVFPLLVGLIIFIVKMVKGGG